MCIRVCQRDGRKGFGLGSLQHAYRRGHVFWWRRVHRLFEDFRLDVRLSLRTFDRLEARNRGAVLTASTWHVVNLLNDRIKAADARPTEEELQAIARTAYGEKLAQFCDDQRKTPHLSASHSAANRTWADYYDRLTRNGGHKDLVDGEEKAWLIMGWDQQRIDGLRMAIEHVTAGNPPIGRRFIDHHLRELGYDPYDGIRAMVERVLYPAYRDACLQAEAQLQGVGGVLNLANTFAPVGEAPIPHCSPAVEPTQTTDRVPPEWIACTPSEAAERMIEATPKLFSHRQGGKRAREQVGEQTLRQIRWASMLLEKSLPPGTPLWKVTEDDIKQLDIYFDQIPTSFGKSPSDRASTSTLADAAAKAADAVADGNLSAEDVGLSTGTSNKHFNKLGQVYAFMRKSVKVGAEIKFGTFTAAIDKDEREARQRYTVDQGRAIFALPPWTGCVGVNDRLTSGDAVIHDGLFYVLLLVWYTGARREELCKLMLTDVEVRHDIPYLLIRDTQTGRVKNQSARRVVVLSSELQRLGFLRYVEAMREADETLLFPELMPGNATKRKLGDVFYKLWWIYIKGMLPDLKRGQAMHSARHMVSDELKDQSVFVEFRNDFLGHRGKGEGENRYPSAASLKRIKEVVEKIPIVTTHLPSQSKIQLLPKASRQARPRRGRAPSTE
jgi:integrase